MSGWQSASIEHVAFAGSEYYCVLYPDMVNSTETAICITDSFKLRLFYATFINSLYDIARRFDSRVIKIGGDSVICYFPETIDRSNRQCFRKVVECGLEMIADRTKINSKLHEKGLPAISYRISADYGKHEVMKAPNSDVQDLIGTTMNICSKINAKVQPNGMRIGGDLYEIVKSCCSDLCFENVGEFFAGLKYAYPVYSVSRK